MSKPSKLAHVQAAVLRLPAVVRPLADPVLAADIAHLLTGFRQPQDADDLLLGELTLAHDSPPDDGDSRGSLSHPPETFSGVRSPRGRSRPDDLDLPARSG